MQLDIQFVVEQDSLKSVLQAIGVPMPQEVTICPFVPGDIIAFSGPQKAAMRVTRRWFRPGDETRSPRWYVHVEQADHPLD